MKKMKLSDYLFIHTDIHRKLSKNKYFLFIGIFLVGLNDIFFGSHYFNINIFNKNQQLTHTLVFYLLFCLIIGLIDILAVALPLSDFSNYLRKKTESKLAPANKRLVMSSYILVSYNFV